MTYIQCCSSKFLHEVCISFLILQTEPAKSFVIRALADDVIEGDEHFTVRLFPADSGAVIDPLNGL